MRSWILCAALLVASVGCAGKGDQAEVPANPVPRENPVTASPAGARGKTAPAPGPQAAPNAKAKQLP
jgi:hypothetical protein